MGARIYSDIAAFFPQHPAANFDHNFAYHTLEHYMGPKSKNPDGGIDFLKSAIELPEAQIKPQLRGFITNCFTELQQHGARKYKLNGGHYHRLALLKTQFEQLAEPALAAAPQVAVGPSAAEIAQRAAAEKAQHAATELQRVIQESAQQEQMTQQQMIQEQQQELQRIEQQQGQIQERRNQERVLQNEISRQRRAGLIEASERRLRNGKQQAARIIQQDVTVGRWTVAILKCLGEKPFSQIIDELANQPDVSFGSIGGKQWKELSSEQKKNIHFCLQKRSEYGLYHSSGDWYWSAIYRDATENNHLFSQFIRQSERERRQEQVRVNQLPLNIANSAPAREPPKVKLEPSSSSSSSSNGGADAGASARVEVNASGAAVRVSRAPCYDLTQDGDEVPEAPTSYVETRSEVVNLDD
ncbi:MAG TPA: hypothetical protein VN457_05750 [Chlamydiales bacterium]|nr:hypothetical protein [Chlamydiales bacterium]